MKMFNSVRNWALGLVLGVAALSAHATEVPAANQDEDQDIIKKNNGQPPVLMILRKDDYESVEGRMRQVTMKVPAFQVKDILYANRVQKYTTATEKRDEGKFLTAAKYFRLALEEMNDRKWAAEYCNFGIAEAFYETETWSGYKDAAGFEYKPAWYYYGEVIKANPKSRYLLECVIKYAIALAKDNKMDEADKAFANAQDQIKKFRTDMGKVDQAYLKMADRAQALGSMGRAQMLELKEDNKSEKEQEYAAALGAFRKAQTDATGKYPDVYGDAVDGEMRVLVKQKDFGAARDRADALIKSFESNSDPALYGMLPGAYMVMGKAEFAMGLEYAQKNQALQAQRAFAEARWNFLHVVVQFFDKEDYVARAHYLAAICYEKRKDVEKDAIDRAISHYRTIVENYPRHELAPKAQEDLKRLGVETPGEKKAATSDKKPDAKTTEPAKPAADPKKADPKAPAKK